MLSALPAGQGVWPRHKLLAGKGQRCCEIRLRRPVIMIRARLLLLFVPGPTK
jgi:hypothetical protein